MALFLTAREVGELFTMQAALEVVEEVFRQRGQGKAVNQPRSTIPLPAGMFRFMFAAAFDMGVMGYKAYGGSRANPARPLVLLYSTETGELLAVLEAGGLGQVRTGAASGVATKYMARADASTVGIIGSGYQAETQLEAVCAVRKVSRVKVYSRTSQRREAFASKTSDALSVNAMSVASAEECVREADIAIVVTNSNEPVIQGEWLSEGCHVNAAGATSWMRRELDDEALRRSDVIVVDDLEQARMECGDIIYPAERAIVRWDQVKELSEVVAGNVKGRNGDRDITLFESLGIALEDIASAKWIYQQAKERGIGVQLPF